MRGAKSVMAGRLIEDGRRVTRGDVFHARSGEAFDGRAAIPAAEAAGAAAILSDAEGCSMAKGPALCSQDSHHVAGVLAHRLAGNPSLSIPVIGITGTNGKTTTASLAHQVHCASHPTALMGGVTIHDGVEARDACLTTPPCDEIAMWLRSAVSNGCRAAIMEVSSHALAQSRVAGIRYEVAVFTNLSGDHLDFHGSMDAYSACKHELFRSLDDQATAIVNIDDPRGRDMLQGVHGSILTCSLRSNADWVGRVTSHTMSGLVMDVTGPCGSWQQRIPLLGVHNAMNALQAMAACCATGLSWDEVAHAMAQVHAPRGRLQAISKKPLVFIDFAHTDAALSAALSALRTAGADRLIVVIGCGGDRDRSKRPRMARIASEAADVVFLTSDNPRTEDPEAILADMKSGVDSAAESEVRVEADRRRAIHAAIEQANDQDIILIAGKGHEQFQIIGQSHQPFDDRLVALEALAARA